PEVVTGAINEFTRALAEAIVIVLVVSFLALGWRSGAVVALCIPVVVAATFIVMHYFAIDLQVVSLGALIISLGLLVDDAIIVVEMMQRKLEEGVDRLHAATAAYEITAFPMLSGTLITAAAFIPIGLAKGIVAEYTASLFSVTAIALLISWFASVLVSPVLGYRMIKVTPPEEQKETRWNAFQKKLLNGFKNSLETVLRYRKTVVLATIAAFLIAAISYPLLKKEFFPASVRPELIVETELPLGATQAATKKMTNEFTAHFYGDNRVSSITSYIGESAPRFILPFEPVPPRANYAQTIIVATDTDARRSLQTDVEQTLADHFPDVRSNIRLIQTGPPAPYPIMYRLSGPDTEQLQKYANEVVQLMQKDKEVSLVNMDWPQMTPSVEVKIDQDRIRQLGADNYAVAADLYTKLSGYQVSSAYLGDQLVPVKFRLPPGRQQLGDLANLAVHVGGGRYVPLGQFATLTPTTENTMIWRRNLTPTITIRANVADDTPADTVSERIYT
ncbi:MAG: efflux RND transporter permease subunit, partial [Negativicoccus succinicivorans]|nr:efflux RND transporter permease subunit [Negativicoccus succinicivorans]